MKNVLILLSGGMDSTTLVHLYKKAGYNVTALSFYYGQRHSTELTYASATADALEIPHLIFNLDQIFNQFGSDSSLISETEVPEGHYAHESMKATVVPNRNMIMTSIAGGLAISKKIENIAYAAHAGDHAIYADCRPKFFYPLQKALAKADYFEVNLQAPFLHYTKAEIAAIGNALKIDWSTTWSCYKGGSTHCGKCGTCVERDEALKLAKDYDAYHLLKITLSLI